MKSKTTFIAGLLCGAVLFGGGTAFAAEVIAQRSEQEVYVDGELTELEAYNIDGNNYVKLRDAGEAVGFNVYWDGSAVQVESDAPYTGARPVTDHSLAANPEIFTGIYTREAYNAIRQAVLDADAILAGEDVELLEFYIPDQDSRWEIDNEISNMVGTYIISLESLGRGYYQPYIHAPNRENANVATEAIIAEVGVLPSDAEKVRALNNYLCDRLIYESSSFSSMNDIFTSDEPLQGNCAVYADAFNYLCWRAGIVAIVVSGENHSWNLVYADGEWLYVDVSLNDQRESRDAMLLTETPRKQASNPEGQAFLQEILVPGSTIK